MEGLRKRKVITLSSIIGENRKATREELELLFRNYACYEISDHVLSWIRTPELVRIVSLAIYNKNVNLNYRDHGFILNLIVKSMPVGRTTLYKYISEIKRDDLD